jgi:serine/threonine-protein kinase
MSKSIARTRYHRALAMGNTPAHVPRFEHYAVTRVLGEGGMGVVYEGQDRRTELPVAVKVMSRHRLSDPDLQRRFLKENEILSSLNHRNIVRCYEITRSLEGMPSIVMEYLDGVDFRAFEGRPYPELLPLMVQACMGLSYLRLKNILHRDLSSNNILVVLERGKRLVKIVDFGVAKILDEARRDGDVKTRTGQFLGKFSFAAPELFLTNAVDWRADVYSLGVIFHRLLTKRTPLKVERAANYYEWVMAHQRPLELDLTAPPGAPALPEELTSIVRKMLAKKAADRPPSYEWIIGALDAIHRELARVGKAPDPDTLVELPPPKPRSSSAGSPAHESEEPEAPVKANEPTLNVGEDAPAKKPEPPAPPAVAVPRPPAAPPVPAAAPPPPPPAVARRVVSIGQSRLVSYGIGSAAAAAVPRDSPVSLAERQSRRKILIVLVIASALLVFAAAFLLVWFFLNGPPTLRTSERAARPYSSTSARISRANASPVSRSSTASPAASGLSGRNAESVHSSACSFGTHTAS